jgi:hypothetical protein
MNRRSVWQRLDRPGLAALSVVALYMLTWWNRYLSPTVGFELTFATEAARGNLPYRDYYFPVQPGWILASIAGTSLFGQKLIGFWVAGVLLRLAGVWCVYRWLTRICPERWAAFATVVTFFISCGDIADFPAWYNYLTFVFAIMAGFAAAKSTEGHSIRGLAWAVVAGLLLAVNLMTKQTTGVLAGIATLLATTVALYGRHGWNRCLRTLGLMVVVAAMPCIATMWWMMRRGMWAGYVDQVWFSGPSSKGGAAGAVKRLVTGTLESTELLHALIMAVVVATSAICVWHAQRSTEGRRRSFLRIGGITLVAGIAVFSMAAIGSPWVYVVRTPLLAAVNASQFGSLVLCFGALVVMLRGRRDDVTLNTGMLGAIGFAAAFAMSLSWPNFEPMVWPGFALVLAFACRRSLLEAGQQWLRPAVVVGGLALMAISVERKLTLPCGWGKWNEPPVWTASTSPTTPALAGFRLSPTTANFFDEVTRLIRSHSCSHEPILVYPHMPIIYGLTDRPLATFAYMHWMDVCPDHVAQADAEQLRRSPPRIMVVMAMSDEMYAGEEAAYRGGRISGQRRLQTAIDELRPRYRLLYSYEVPGMTLPILVLERVDQESAAP